MRTFRIAWTISAVLAAGCGNDDGGPINRTDAGPQPDTGVPCMVEPTYASIHDALLSTTTCAALGCHGDSPQGGLSLDMGPNAVFTELTEEDVAHPDAQATRRVVPGDAASSFLFLKVAEENPQGGSRMPLGTRDGLPQCEIDAIEAWINAGAPR